MRDRHEPPGGPYDEGDWDLDYTIPFDGAPAGPADDLRRQGLRRLSKLTWRATQLSAVAAVGFAALFAHAAHAQTVSTPAPAKPTARPTTASPTPSPSPTHKKKHHHHHKAAPTAAPAAPTAPASAAPTLAPPTTAPAPPPPSPAPSPVQTHSSGSGKG
jgi:hypothetical protein